ncbi:MAG: N-acetylglucosamine-6-phosphate deacetylase, partial [Limisphaerales bacterium]
MNDGEICARHFATQKPIRLKWENGVITQLEEISDASQDLWIAPTLFDLQINGYGGFDFQQDDLTEVDLLSAARKLLRDGCGRFLLTLITDDWKKLMARLRHVKALHEKSPELKSAIVGWHLEGPFLSEQPGFHGAHNPDRMRDPTLENIRELRGLTENDPLLLTMAPERNGAVEAISLAASLGIKISLGHTNASAEILQKAVRAGATSFTHLANGCPRELDRHDNILWRIFETSGLKVSLIPDQIHVSSALFRLVHRMLKPEN